MFVKLWVLSFLCMWFYHLIVSVIIKNDPVNELFGNFQHFKGIFGLWFIINSIWFIILVAVWVFC